MSSPIILIGFKHTGKSILGQALAHTLKTDFIDLDTLIEKNYGFTCREIAKTQGLDYFRSIEASILKKAIIESPGVLSVGGGTPLSPENRQLISQGLVIHVRAPKGRVFERIMISGRPAFFPQDVEAYDAFIQIWQERDPIYRALANHSIDNLGSVEEGVNKILQSLHEETFA